jgi:DNA invertase Pin-like site-specific DNA recombinase
MQGSAQTANRWISNKPRWPQQERRKPSARRSVAQSLTGRHWLAQSRPWVLGDVLLVTRLDRLARSTRDLLNVLDAVGKAGAGFRSLADTWADTTTPHGRLMLTVLGGLAEFERELIKARTAEGRKRAQARGVRFGRKLKLNAHQRREALARREAGEALTEIGRTFGVSHSTISRLRDWLLQVGTESKPKRSSRKHWFATKTPASRSASESV